MCSQRACAGKHVRGSREGLCLKKLGGVGVDCREAAHSRDPSPRAQDVPQRLRKQMNKLESRRDTGDRKDAARRGRVVLNARRRQRAASLRSLENTQRGSNGQKKIWDFLA